MLIEQKSKKLARFEHGGRIFLHYVLRKFVSLRQLPLIINTQLLQIPRAYAVNILIVFLTDEKTFFQFNQLIRRIINKR